MKAIILLSILAVASAGISRAPLQQVEPKNWFSDIVLRKIKALLPKLADLAVSTIDLAESGRVNNITVLHLDTALVYANAKGATSTFLNNVTATVGSVEVAGQFEFNNADLDGLILNGAGALSAQVSNAVLYCQLDFKLVNLIQPVLKDILGLSLTIGSAKISLEGIDGGAETEAALEANLQNLINLLIAEDFPLHKQKIIDYINSII